MSKVVVIGSINIDKTTKLPHLPQKGETILGEDVTESCGGKGANQAYAAAKLCSDVIMLGAVGDDSDGQKAINNLKSVGVHTEHIKITNRPTGSATILITDKGDNIIVVMPGANKCCDVEYLKSKQDIIKNADIILLQLEIPLDSIRYVFKNKSDQSIVILDPAPYNKNLTLEDLKHVDILTPNESELEYLIGTSFSGIKDIEKNQFKTLLMNGPKNVIITQGDKGGVIVGANIVSSFKSIKVEVVDTTAAGDTFNGALASRLAIGDTLDNASKWANHAAAISVTKLGAQNSIPSIEEVNIFINEKGKS